MKIVAACLVLLLTSSAAFAQQRGGQAQARAQAQDQVPPPMALGEIQKLLDGYAIVQAQDYLGMTDAQFGPFLPKLRALQDVRRRNEQERMRLLMELRRLTNPRAQAQESDIRDRVRLLRELQSRSVSDVQRAYDSIDQSLERPAAGAVPAVRAGNRTAKTPAPDAHPPAKPREPPQREPAIGLRAQGASQFCEPISTR